MTAAVGAATKLSITQSPTGGSSGGLLTQQPWIAIQDATSTTVTSSSASVTVSIASGSGGTLGGTTTVSASSGIAKFTDLTFAGTVGTTYTLTFTSTPLSPVTSSTITVTFGTASKVAISTAPVLGSSSSVMATQPVITIQDAQGNTVTNSSASVTVSIASGAGGTLSGTESSGGKAASSGMATFSNLAFSGTANTNYTFTFASSGLTSATTANLQVSGSSSKIGFNTLPILGSSGSSLAQNPVIAIQDVNGNTVTSDNSTSVTVSIASGAGGSFGVLNTLTRTAVNGFATFSGLTFTGSGTYTLTFTATIGGSSKTATTGSLSLSGSANKLTVSTQPVGSTSGGTLTTQPVVRVEDSNGQLVTSSTLLVTASALGTGGYIFNSSSVTATAVGGIATFSGLKFNGVVGTSYQLSFAGSSVTSGTSGPLFVAPGSASKLTILTQPAGGASGDLLSPQPVVRIEDVDGNLVSGSSATVTVSIYSGASGVLAGGEASSGVNASAGRATFNNLTLAGLSSESYVLRFASAGLTSAQSDPFKVTEGAISLANALISASSTTLVADGSTTTTITIQSRDAQGNPVSTDGGVLALSASGGGTIGPVTNNVDGTYTATYTAGASAGTAIISGTYTDPSPDVAITNSLSISLVSNNANLSALALTTATLDSSFSSGTTSYTATVPNTTTSITVTPTVSESHATVTVNGTAVTTASASGSISLTAGAATTITVVVTAQNATTKTYTVSVTRTAAETTSTLSGLSLSVGTLSPTFSSSTLSYTASSLSGTTAITVTPTASGSFSTIQVKVGSGSYASVSSGSASSSLSLAYGNNTVTILVTAQDLTTSTYSVVINRPLISRTISFTSPPTSLTYGSTATLSASPSAGPSEGSVSYSVGASTGCSLTGAVLSVTDATGTCSISSTVTSGATYASATTSASVTLNKATQTTLNLSSLGTSSKTYPFSQALSASTTGGSGSGSVTYAVTSGTASGCALSNTTSTATISATSSGTCLVTATKAGGSNYNDATSSASTFTFNKATQSALSISSLGTSSKSYPYSQALSATTSGGSSSGSVTYAVANGTSTDCALSSTAANATITASTIGTCLITATMAGGTNYNDVSSSSSTFTFSKATPSISISLPAGATTASYGTAVTITATSGAAGTLNFKVGGTTISGCGTVATSDGICSWTPGAVGASTLLTAVLTPTSTANYNSNTSSTLTINVGAAAQTISFGALSDKSYGDANFTVSATASSGLTVAFASTTTSVCTVSTTTVHIVKAGDCTIKASQAGNASYGAAADVNQTFTISKVTLHVTASSPSVVYGAAIPTITPSYTSGDFVNSENASSSSFTTGLTAPTCTTTYTTTSNAGTTPSTSCSGGSATNYTFSFTSGSVTIGQATPAIHWATPAPIRDNIPLSSTQLNATANVSGSWSYTPSSGMLSAGTQVLSVTFTPTDSTNYTTASSSVNLFVTGATAPNAPNAPSITNVGVTTSSSLAITWTPVTDANNGGSTITKYQFRFSAAIGSPSFSDWADLQGTSGTSESITVTSTSKSYIVQVRACNIIGCSGTSSSSSAATSTGVIVTAPASAPSASASLNSSSGAVTVTYAAVSGAVSYQYSTDDGATWKTAGSSGFTFTATKGTEHKVKVRAINSAGNGPGSSASTVKWQTKPGKPTSAAGSLVGTSGTQVSISFTLSDNGGGTTRYEYRSGSDSDDEEVGHSTWQFASAATNPFTVNVGSNDRYYRFQIRACNGDDENANCGEPSESFRVNANRARITTQPSSTSLTTGQSASYDLSVTAVPAASESLTYTWYRNSVEISGATSSTYRLSSITSAKAGTYKVVVHAGAIDLESNEAVVTVNSAPTLSTTTFAGATVGLSYSYNLPGANGTPNYKYTVGTLPSGLSYSSEYKRITGTVSRTVSAGAKTFTVVVTDSKDVSSSSYTVTINVSTPITITTTTLGAASKGSIYTTALAVSGGSAPYTWTLDSGSDPLPTGFSLDASTGVLSSGGVNVPDNAASSSFDVLVTDGNGATDTQKLTLSILAGIPNAPRTPAASPASKEITLTWTDPEAKSGVSISNFIISYVKPKGEHSEDGGNDDEERGSISVDGSAHSYTVTGLTNGLPYTFTISAKSSGGTGAPSSQVTATPLGRASAPQSVTAALGRNGISVRWKKPNESGGGSINTWVIACSASGGETITKTFSEGDGDEEHSEDGQNRYSVYSDDDNDASHHLIAGHAYTCTVAAKTTKGSTTTVGTPSSPSSSVTFASVPSAPSTLSGTYNAGARKITVTWTASASNGGSTIKKYIAWIKQGDSEEGKRQCFTDINGITCDISNLPSKGHFTLRAVAVNDIGQSDEATVDVEITGRDQTLTLPTISDKTIGDADFNVGASSSAGLNLKYSKHSDSGSNCSVTEKGTVKVLRVGICKLTIEQNGHKSDEHGDDSNEESEYRSVSGTITFNIVDRLPSAPTVTTVASGNTQLTINWSAPSSAGGTPTGYQVAVVKVADCGVQSTCTWNESSTVSTSPLNLPVGSLLNGTPYYVKVRAINGAGGSAWAYGSSSYIPYKVPDAPSITGITTFSETSTATIAWSAPANNGNAINSYTVTATPGGATCTTGGTRSCSISGLTNGTTYSFKVYAHNAAGNGPESGASTATIDQVAQTVAFTESKSMYGYAVGDPNVEFKAAATSGLPVQWSTSDATVCTVTSGGSVRIISSGTCEVIIAQNGRDAGGARTRYAGATYTANTATIVIDPATPSAPTLISVTNTQAGLVLVWTAPARAGGTITYAITGVNGSNTANCTVVSLLTCTIQPSNKGMSYGFTVVAQNAAGNSPASNTKYGTWIVKPSAPRTDGSHASAASSSDGKAIDLHWLLSADDGGESITRYVATATEGANSTTCSVTRTDLLDTNGYGCSITGLKARVTYAVTVLATNSAGNSFNLSIGNITPGLAQTITLNSPTSSAMTKYFNSADFNLSASASSGKALSYSTSDSSCEVGPSTGLVHVLTIGTCVVAISQAGATNADPSQYLATSTNVTITILPVLPGAAVITKVTPGDKTLTVTWTSATFTGGDTTSESVTATAASGGAVTNCTISGHSAECTFASNGGTYSIVVNTTNSVGTTPSAPASAIPFYNALAPMPLTATGDVRKVILTWSAPAQIATGKTHTGYRIYMKYGGTIQFLRDFNDTSTVTTEVTVDKMSASLLNSTTYEFVASALVTDDTTHVESAGEQTGVVSAKTLSLPSKPQSVVATTSGSSVIFTWQEPASDGGSSIIGYTVYKLSGGTTTSYTAGGSSTRSYTFTGLTPGANYTFSVRANNGVGQGELESVSLTAESAPTAPVITAVTQHDPSGSATIEWSAATSSSPISSYTVVAYTASGATSLTCSVPGTTVPLTCDITGLSYKVAYTFKVYATNAVGNGANSDPSTPSITLHKTQTITFAALANKSFSVGSVALTATASSGLAVTYTSSTLLICSTTAGSSTLTFVKAGTCTVVASQRGASSDYDAAESVTRTFSITAETPSALVLTTVDPGASKLYATWVDAVDLGGSTLDYYVLSWAQNADFSDEDQTTVLAANSDINGLLAEHTYRVRVQVVAKSGLVSEWSNVLTGTTYGLPSKPRSVTASQIGTGIVKVSWLSSLTNGGTPIIGYTATAYNATTGVATSFTCSAASGDCTITGLAGSVTYYFVVTAINAVGGTDSDPTTNIQPGAAQSITVGNYIVDHTAAPFADAATADSGLTLSYSVISEVVTGVAPAHEPTWGAGRHVCTVSSTGLITVDLAGICTIQVSQNGTMDGTSGGTPSSFLPATSVTQTVTVNATAPNPTTGLLLTPADSLFDATWVAPTDDGGMPIVKYTLNWYLKSLASRPTDSEFTTSRLASNPTPDQYGLIWNLPVTSAGVTTLSRRANQLQLINGETYVVEVTAVNSAGLIGPLL